MEFMTVQRFRIISQINLRPHLHLQAANKLHRGTYHHDCILRGPSLPLAIHLFSSTIFAFTFSFFVTLRCHRDFPTWLSYQKIAVQQSILVLFYLTQLDASLHFRYLTHRHGVSTFYRPQTALVQALTNDRTHLGSRPSNG